MNLVRQPPARHRRRGDVELSLGTPPELWLGVEGESSEERAAKRGTREHSVRLDREVQQAEIEAAERDRVTEREAPRIKAEAEAGPLKRLSARSGGCCRAA